MKEKTRIIYVVHVKRAFGSEYQHFKPSEFHLLKTILKQGYQIIGLSREEMSSERYKSLFGE